MPDLSQQWGADLTIGSTGDLAVTAGVELGRQRVLRRLLTNPSDYIWHPDFGAGLARFVGQPANVLQIRALVRSQIFKEARVARTPEPIIDVSISPAGAVGTVYVHIRYQDSPTGKTQVLTFSVGA